MLGPYAKVTNCPIEGSDDRMTCYATGYADTMWTVPACTTKKHHYVSGYFTLKDENIVFVPKKKYQHLFNPQREKEQK